MAHGWGRQECAAVERLRRRLTRRPSRLVEFGVLVLPQVAVTAFVTTGHQEFRDQTGPAGLVRGTQAAAVSPWKYSKNGM